MSSSPSSFWSTAPRGSTAGEGFGATPESAATGASPFAEVAGFATEALADGAITFATTDDVSAVLADETLALPAALGSFEEHAALGARSERTRKPQACRRMTTA